MTVWTIVDLDLYVWIENK